MSSTTTTTPATAAAQKEKGEIAQQPFSLSGTLARKIEKNIDRLAAIVNFERLDLQGLGTLCELISFNKDVSAGRLLLKIDPFSHHCTGKNANLKSMQIDLAALGRTLDVDVISADWVLPLSYEEEHLSTRMDDKVELLKVADEVEKRIAAGQVELGKSIEKYAKEPLVLQKALGVLRERINLRKKEADSATKDMDDAEAKEKRAEIVSQAKPSEADEEVMKDAWKILEQSDQLALLGEIYDDSQTKIDAIIDERVMDFGNLFFTHKKKEYVTALSSDSVMSSMSVVEKLIMVSDCYRDDTLAVTVEYTGEVDLSKEMPISIGYLRDMREKTVKIMRKNISVVSEALKGADVSDEKFAEILEELRNDGKLDEVSLFTVRFHVALNLSSIDKVVSTFMRMRAGEMMNQQNAHLSALENKPVASE